MTSKKCTILSWKKGFGEFCGRDIIRLMLGKREITTWQDGEWFGEHQN